jgi:cellulose synthase/poly-beta-1,6-N-acetylglucosamine synthase-like glycosyltransferase/transposase-like protein
LPPKLSPQERLKLIERVILKGEPVSKVCQEARISRTLFYRWLQRYKKEGKVTPKKRARVTPRRVSEENILKILELVLIHPKWSSQKVSLSLPKIDDKPLVGNHGVQNVLLRLDLNTIEKRKDFAEKAKDLEPKEALKVARGEVKVEEKIIRPVLKPKELTPAQRLEMIERAIKYGEPVVKVCRDFEVSRPVFYKWLKRYLSVPEEERVVVLHDKKPKVERYYRQTPEKYEEAILSVVAQYPQFGVARIVLALPMIAGKPIIGHHGVQNVLRRNNLNTYEKRLAYAQAQVTPVTRLISRFVELGTQFIVLPAPTRAKVIKFASISLSVAFSTIVALGVVSYFATITAAAPPASKIGLFFATIALGIGSIFFAYSMKYYLTLALVLSFSRQPLEEAMPAGRQGGGYSIGLNGGINNRKNGNGPPVGGWLQRVFGLRPGGPQGPEGLGNGRNGEGAHLRQGYSGQGGGLQPSLDHIRLKRYPFVSVHLPFYNEKKVAERILKACTSMDYPGDCYEVIVCDDSTDETIDIVQKYAEAHKKAQPQGPKLKVIHRPTREGFKGGALKYAVKNMDPRTEFCVVFDADFIPYPDTLGLFIKYFKANNNNTENYTKSNIAVIGGYQWHVLNKSENWVTRGVRTEYAGSYVIERPGREILGLLKQISGAVYMIRADVLKKVGWGTSITEDFQLTLKLYEQGYKVVYTPYVQAPAECVSTLTRLIRQRMRWAEGHSNNIRRMFLRLMLGRWKKVSGEAGETGEAREKERAWVSSPLSWAEKLELLYISPYYLQAFFFLLGTFSWLLAETVFPARLPFWTSLWGWSLVLTNFFSLPLVNAVGLFLEESEEKDYLGLLSFIALSYILVPFQAYASVKGFIEREEGPWFRTPKTGRITDVFTRGRFYRWISGILPGRSPAPAPAVGGASEGRPAVATAQRSVFGGERLGINPYLALATANNQFNNFTIKPKRIRWVSNFVFTFFIFLVISLVIFSPFVPLVNLSGAQARSFATLKEAKAVDELSVKEEEITGPVNQTYDFGDGTLEYIFHPEPRVRIKLGDKEVEMKVVGSSGLGNVRGDRTIKEGVVYTYENIFTSTDLRYTAKASVLKEEFILKEYRQFESINEEVKLTGLMMAQVGNEVQIASEEGGAPLFSFTRPLMYEEKNPELKSEGIIFQLEKEPLGYRVKKVLTEEGKRWLADPSRVFPVVIDPTMVQSSPITSGFLDAEAILGSFQRKIVYSSNSSAWYTIDANDGAIHYQKCVPATTDCDADGDWESPVTISLDTATQANPSAWFQAAGTGAGKIFVAWIDDAKTTEGTVDCLAFRTIDTADSDTLGTQCNSPDMGSLVVGKSYAYIAAGNNGDVLAGVSNFGVPDAEMDIWEVPTTTCDFTSREAGSGLPAISQTVAVVPFEVATNRIQIIYNDAGGNNDLRQSQFDISSSTWNYFDNDVDGANNQDVITFSAVSDGTDVWVLRADSATTTDFFRCSSCSGDTAPTWTQSDSVPWSSETNISEVSLTYISTTPSNTLAAMILKDTNEQAYFKTTDADTISWSDEYSFNFTAGGADPNDNGNLSSTYSVATDEEVGVVIREAAAYSFSTLPENYLFLLFLSPLLPGILKKLRERRQSWKLV